jgi:hypothetical protein
MDLQFRCGMTLVRPFVENNYFPFHHHGGRCREAGVRPSMGSVGDAYDNAMCESFFATLVRYLSPIAYETQVLKEAQTT